MKNNRIFVALKLQSMKETTKQNEYVFDLWSVMNMTFDEIAVQKIPSFLSLKRIRNIIYGGLSRLKSDHERKIYSIFRMKFLELKDVKEAIIFTYNFQPDITISVRNVRNIINAELANKRATKRNTVKV